MADHYQPPHFLEPQGRPDLGPSLRAFERNRNAFVSLEPAPAPRFTYEPQPHVMRPRGLAYGIPLGLALWGLIVWAILA